jgi:meso-butanediol dehydrogenase / (S,S)-butanediol dehydrogenase / diacetyl reductase
VSPEGRLAGKIVVVTGASQGIGAAIARSLHEEGAVVGLLARSEAPLVALSKELGSERTVVLRCDVTDPDNVRAAFEKLRDRCGSLDALINNAGLIAMALLADASDSSIHDIVATNLLGPMFCIRSAIPLLTASGGGHIINISSRAVELARPYLSVYSATKGGLEVLSRTLSAELRPEGIFVSAIRVGPTASAPAVQSDGSTQGITDEWVARGGPRPETPAPVESVAEAVLYVLTQPPGARVPIIHVEPR